jgi:L,D-transpeptidase ErfK/SrfK
VGVRRVRRVRVWIVSAALAVAGCEGGFRVFPHRGPVSYDEATFAGKKLVAFSIPAPTPGSDGIPAETVIGRVRTHRLRAGETLLDVARYHDLGYNEITEANPGVDPWTPPEGTTIVLPTAWVMPCCTFEGLVLNIPEMRLYFYRPDPHDPKRLLVVTHPVGIGRATWRTPRGRFTVRGKTKDPVWIIPESIRKERLEDKNDTRGSIPGGDPENPLGRYRLELTIPRYAIHGTNQPWGIGRLVSHGCVQLYPEDIHRLFPLVPVGTPVEFTYQPLKVGTRDGAVYVEVHPDIYKYAPTTLAATRATLARRKLSPVPDPKALAAALRESRGVPVALVPAAGRAQRSARPDADSSGAASWSASAGRR